MADRFTVVVTAPDEDACAAAALVGRCVEGHVEPLVFDSERLAAFFDHSVQQKLPHGYDLAFCGLEVVHTDWDGRLVRPKLMDALRSHIGPVRWFAACRWDPVDRQAIEQMIGRSNLVASETAESTAALVAAHYGQEDDAYARLLVELADGSPAAGEAARAHGILTALKGNHRELAVAVSLLMEERLAELVRNYGAAAERVDQENRRSARERASEPRPMSTFRLVCLSLPREKHAFWAEISAYARELAEAELALCRLEGRPVMVLTRGREPWVDLQVWARYVTDLLPAARSVGARPDVVPLIVDGLRERPGLMDEVLELMAEGAHLLKG
jgi:hypothetical protein